MRRSRLREGVPITRHVAVIVKKMEQAVLQTREETRPRPDATHVAEASGGSQRT